MDTKNKCEECPMSFFTYHWNRTRCKLYDGSLNASQIRDMYQGCTNGKGVVIFPDWCPRLKYVHVKY